ncbi:class I SAM-dependent methyltransferase [Agrobacterium larrymoorei]|uniref:Ribosomal RNA small subunit methyltransferase J n=1 Tax=Agrobacterium larrymoorei TaxID=160699 RepID=A0A4D7E0C9_9HYPH|nr:class I SAM-dependent methyltransferase [Agrobacterium larrymoorei]QCI99792.1 16S rRNA methyltransferase [Agrobacterium larrymoorei]QYA09774.1 class I SAM-dependent methyltransferase [Agrobacterium larrymoorei]
MAKKEPTESYVVDFVGGAVGHRLRSGEGRGQALPKAAGFSKGRTPKIVDATAGLGRDAFLLASLGAEVMLIERSPEMHAHLLDGIERARAAGGVYENIASRMTLLHGDSRELLKTLDPEVVIVDPMHPPRQNTALVKKEMRVLRDVVGSDPDQRELMEVALECARKRVVLKWPLRAAAMAGIQKPSHQILGKNTRYDVFMIFGNESEPD